MHRSLALAAALVLAACQQDPVGRCTTHLDCNVGQECSGGVCIALATDHQIGSRCIRDADCVAWAGCAGELCTLAAGMCTTGTDCAGWQLCDNAHACVAAPGRCATAADCRVWEICDATNTCENGPGYCAANADCAAWQTCNTTIHACATASGFCADDLGCAGWQYCAADHKCALVPGMCERNADCASWDVCGAAHTCVHGPGYCATNAECSPWEECNAVHACAAAPGFCSSGSDCEVWELCSASHVCENGPGYCASSAECATWQECNSVHACVAATGFCADDAGCAEWLHCGADHVCALDAGRCAASSDCLAYQVCSGAHVCETAPGHCGSDAECHAPQTCISNWCSDAPPGAFDGANMLLIGTLQEGSGPTCLARLEAPRIPYAGFGRYSPEGRAFVNPQGEIVYMEHQFDSGDRRRLRIFRPDSFVWDADLHMWMAPGNQLANDPEIPTAACDAPDTSGPGYWVMQGGTGEILYSCNAFGATGVYYDTAGTARLTGPPDGYRIESWNANGTMLVMKVVASVQTWMLLGPTGTEIPLNGLQFGPQTYLSAVRTYGDGFRLLVAKGTLTGNANEWTLWFVDSAGTASKVGTYAKTDGAWDKALDADGNAYFWVDVGSDMEDDIQRCAPDGACSIVYTEVGAPNFGWWTTDPPSFFVYLHGATSSEPLTTAP